MPFIILIHRNYCNEFNGNVSISGNVYNVDSIIFIILFLLVEPKNSKTNFYICGYFAETLLQLRLLLSALSASRFAS